MSERMLKRRVLTLANISPKIAVGISLMHIMAIAAIFFFSWPALILCLFMIWLTACVGITLCYHRLLTHGAFKTPNWFKYVLTVIACLAWQGGPLKWCGVHRLHHKEVDTEDDPHTPRHGFSWSHWKWPFDRHTPEQKAAFAKTIPDLYEDKGLVFLDKWFIVPQLLLFPIFYILGEWLKTSWHLDTSGLSLVLWGIGMRTTIVYHGTWFVNSAAHTWGYRNFDTKDLSTNLWWVALLSFGEGNHNNHHAFQKYARHGLRWYEIDMTWWLICFLEKVGLASKVFINDDWKKSPKLIKVDEKVKVELKDSSPSTWKP